MKKLEWARELVLKEKCRLSNLRKHGFVRVVPKKSSTPSIYIHRKKRIVVKRPYLTDDKMPKAACPTLIIDSPDPRCGILEKIFIQPLVDVSDDAKWAAHSILNEKQESGDLVGADLKESNCGMYKRKPVIFDW